jgi:hypothetical protein
MMYEIIYLPDVLCGYRIWSFNLSEEHRLRVFESSPVVLREIQGSKRRGDRDWRKLRKEELHELCCSINIIGTIKSKRGDWWSM